MPTRPDPSPPSLAVRAGWPLVLLLIVVLPLTTGGEKLIFYAAGFELNVRFAVYATASLVASLLALPVAVRMARQEPASLAIPAAFLGWLVFTALLAGQPAREWLPTITRWVLYLSVLLLALSLARSASDDRLRDRTRMQLRGAIVAAMVVPLVVGAWELATGSARILNNAPRISATLFGHPVAYSLLLMVGGLVLLPMVLGATGGARSRRAIVGGLMLLAVLAELMFTYTRLTLVLALAGGVVIAIAMRPRSRMRTALVGGLVSVLVLTVAFPLLITRFEQPVVWSPPSATPVVPRSSPIPTATPRLVVIDNSAKLRIKIHSLGLGYVLDSPVVGHGPGSFDRLFQRDTGREGVAAHNDILLAAVESGVPGMLLMLLLYATVLIPLLGSLVDGRPDAGFAAAAATIFGLLHIGAALHNPTYFPEFEVAAWAAVGVALGAVRRPWAPMWKRAARLPGMRGGLGTRANDAPPTYPPA